MVEIQVHTVGTKVVIDHENDRIGTIYKGATEPAHGWSKLSDETWAGYKVCQMCKQKVSDEQLAWAFWKHEKPYCSTACVQKKQLAQHACCDLATSMNCVCAYATKCPIHGERHFGTHD